MKLGERLIAGGREAFFRSRLYNATLRCAVPEQLLHVPQDPWPGDPSAADALFRGQFTFAGKLMQAENKPLWNIDDESEEWAVALHGFIWLRHFRANGTEAGRRHARALVRSWIERFYLYDSIAWRPDVIGQRIVSWLYIALFLWEGSEEEFQWDFLDSLARQSKHLHRTLHLAPAGHPRFLAVLGYIHCGLCLPKSMKRFERGMELLEEELEEQITPDGGHISRNPVTLTKILADLIALQNILVDAELEVPRYLRNTIDRISPMVRFFRHGDGGFALFHGATEEEWRELDLVLDAAQADGDYFLSPRYAGYERLEGGNALVIMDVDDPPDPDISFAAHMGPLAFEFSSGKHRIVVNAGAGAPPGSPARQAARSTSAHSTAMIKGRDAYGLNEADGSIFAPLHPLVSSRSNDPQSGHAWVNATHYGYYHDQGLTHNRQLFMDAHGMLLRGIDTFEATTEQVEEAIPLVVRFHLHPDINAHLTEDGENVLLKVGEEEVWRFGSDGGKVALEDSRYLGDYRDTRRSQQITISSFIRGGKTEIEWGFLREA